MKLSPEDLIRELSSVIDPTFARTAVESYIDMQQRFLAGDWGPAELNGGRLCEAVSRSLLQLDTGKISHTDSPGDVRKHLLDNNLPHNIIKSKDRYHIAKAIEVVYKFRSDRGPVHISPDYSANYMDSMFVLHAGKWIFAELLRLALKRDIKTVADTIAQLVQMQHSIIHELANDLWYSPRASQRPRRFCSSYIMRSITASVAQNCATTLLIKSLKLYPLLYPV